MDWGYTLSGLLVGILVGLTGVGGGSLMTPLLVFVFGIPPVKAVGTDLLFAAITKSGGVWIHSRLQTIEWRIVGLLAAGSVPASLLTTYGLQQIGVHNERLNTIITTALGFALILTSIALLFKGEFQQLGRRLSGQKLSAWKEWRWVVTVIAGIILGVLVTLTSVGAGALGAAILFFLYPGLPTVRIVGTDIAHAVPLTAVAGLGHLHMGTVDFVLLGSLLLGSLPGIYLGSRLSHRVPEKVMRPILASMLMLIGVKFVW
ncbi:MAG: sulfite exporter TauE/SafE family protein [Pseudomonadota bacterium]